MADIVVLAHRRVFRRERVFVDRENPLEIYDDNKFFVRYRMRPATILFIFNLIADQLNRTTKRSMALPPLLQFLVAVRFLGCGSFYTVVGDTIPRVSKASVCRCVWRVCDALSRLLPAVVKMPAGRMINATKQAFHQIAGKCITSNIFLVWGFL